jgi:hypothetical protein
LGSAEARFPNEVRDFVGVIIIAFLTNLGIIVLIDYVSLLFVRRFLGLAQNHAIGASLLSSAVGIMMSQ